MAMAANPKQQTMTLEEFERFAVLPENSQRRLEFVDGEVVELVSNEISAHITSLLTILVGGYIVQHQLGYTTSSESGFRIGNNDYMPDFAFISKARREKPIGETWITVAPDLVIEVKSPTDSLVSLISKATDYLAAGVRMVWIVLPDKRRVDVYTQEDNLQYGVDGMITGGDVLPGFTLKVAEIFAQLGK
jgi:Uma2 family endonuclease